MVGSVWVCKGNDKKLVRITEELPREIIRYTIIKHNTEKFIGRTHRKAFINFKKHYKPCSEYQKQKEKLRV